MPPNMVIDHQKWGSGRIAETFTLYMAGHETETSHLSLDYQVSTHVHLIHCLPLYECNNLYTTLRYLSFTSSKCEA
jgi:hypothetical protein